MTTATTSKPKVLTALLAVQQGIDSIPKTGVGPAAKGSFAFMQFDDVVSVVHKLLNDNKILLRPEFEIEHTVDRSTSRAQITALIRATYTFTSAEDGSEFVVKSVGEGSDIGSDTASRKAASQALKIALLQTFSIPTGEYDPESDEPKEAPVEQPKVQQAKRAVPAKPEDKLATLRVSVGKLAGKNNLTSGEVNQIASDNGLTDAYNNVEQLSKLVDLLEGLSE